jgi:hypothetical protein
VVGGYDAEEAADAYAAMVRATTEQQVIVISVWDRPTTPPSAWPAVRGHDVPGCWGTRALLGAGPPF